MLCAVSNDGSVNAWAYPVNPLPIEEPDATATSPDVRVDEEVDEDGQREKEDQDEEKGEENEGENTNKENTGVGTPRAGTPEREGEVGETITAKQNIGEDGQTADVKGETGDGDGDGDVDMDVTTKPSETTADVQPNVSTPAAEPATEGDVVMSETAAESTQPEPLSAITTSSSRAPSRQVSPGPASTPKPVPQTDQELIEKDTKQAEKKREEEKKKLRQLKRLRHFVCHSASLLSLSFDPLGRYV
jgi:hypothetical protein